VGGGGWGGGGGGVCGVGGGGGGGGGEVASSDPVGAHAGLSTPGRLSYKEEGGASQKF